MTTVAIMQPTFLPWIGYFALIDAVDHFFFLDDVQFSRQSWQSRNRICGRGAPIWLSLKMRRKPSRVSIAEAKVVDDGFEAGLIAALDQVLSGMPHRAVAVDLVRQGFDESDGRLSSLNRAIIDRICDATGIATPRYTTSEGNAAVAQLKTDRLVDLCRSVDGAIYVSPPGAIDYLARENAFPGSGIDLKIFNYSHPEYAQGGDAFVSHMSAVEALAAVGPDGFAALARQGVGAHHDLEELLEVETPVG
ncbi:MAG: WbqC family protein [Rhodobacteraceae bacterium]|nr:WbqC family protein [Paracoccaceae bacterium]